MNYMEAYRQWLEMFRDDEATYLELLSIKDDEEEIKDRFYADLTFGTAGMRGIIAAGRNRMNVYSVRRATQGFADYMLSTGSKAPVAIGYDSRRFSKEFALESALVLAANGIKALLFDALRPVALLSFAVRHYKCIAGIVITASHNSAEYNGYKTYWSDGAQLPPEPAEAVTASINAVSYDGAKLVGEQEAIQNGLLEYIGAELDELYYAMVLKLSIRPDECKKHGGDISIVYTPLNGSGTVPVTEVLSRAGFSSVYVVPEQRCPDPDFKTVGTPNPENKNVYELALKLADEKGADLVFATDPDCDRVGVAAKVSGGEYAALTGNQIGVLLSHYIVSALREKNTLPKNGAIVKSIVSTEVVRGIAEDFGVEVVDVLTGFKFIAEKIQMFEETGDRTFLFGFEESCGYLSGTSVRDKDGVNASLLLAECALMHKQAGRTLYEGLTNIYDTYGWCLESVAAVKFPGANGQDNMARAMSGLRANPPGEIGGVNVAEVIDYQGDITGFTKSNVLFYRLDGGSWVCVRPSGTEPTVKLYVNCMAKTQAAAEGLLPDISSDAQEMLGRAIG